MTALTNIASGLACDVLTENCSSPALPRHTPTGTVKTPCFKLFESRPVTWLQHIISSGAALSNFFNVAPFMTMPAFYPQNNSD